jgi:hypothetical protein
MTATRAGAASSRHPWTGAAVAWTLLVAVVLVWIGRTSTGNLREQLKSLQFWSLECCLALCVAFAAAICKDMARHAHRSDAVRLCALAAVAIGLTVLVAPRTNRIFYDEQIYQGVGQNLADLRLAQVCNDGSVEYGRLHCVSGEYNKQPYAYPHLLSVAYRLFGVRSGTAFAVNALAMAVSVCGVYVLVCLLFGDRDAALFAGLILALTPQQILWSATASVEPSASCAAILSLLCAAYYSRRGGTAALGAMVVMAAYGLQFRPESILVLPLMVLLAWPRLRRESGQPATWWAAFLFCALTAVHVAHLYSVRNLKWGAELAPFSFHYVAGNFPVNAWFYVSDERFPGIFILLALCGLAAPGFRRERTVLALYFAVYFSILLVFYAGSYNYGADIRYSLMTYPPIAILAGVGTGRLVRLASNSFPARGVAAAALGWLFLWYAPVVRATTEEAWAARADVRAAREFAASLPPNSYVLTHNPAMFHIWGTNAGQLPLIVPNPAYVNYLAGRYAGGVYIHWNFWCNVRDPVHPEECRKALELGPVELVREYRERDQRFALYRITRPPS